MSLKHALPCPQVGSVLHEHAPFFLAPWAAGSPGGCFSRATPPASADTPLVLRRREPRVYPFRTGLGGRVQRWRRESDTTKVLGLVPVHDALVEVRGPGSEGPTVQVRTNVLGRFALPLAPGDYLVRWERQRKQVPVEEGRVSEVELGG